MRLKQIFYALIIGVGLLSCVGEQGEPGPIGLQGEKGDKGDKGDAGDDGADGENGEDGADGETAQKSGFFEGSLTGTRRDGTPFTYNFKFDRKPKDGKQFYEWNPYNNYDADQGVEGFVFNEFKGHHELILAREDSAFGGNSPSWMGMLIALKNKGLENEELTFEIGGNNQLGLFFVQEISPTTIFKLEAEGFMYSETFISISESENASYNLANTGIAGEGIYYQQTEYNGAIYSAVFTNDFKTVLFENINDGTRTSGEFQFLLDINGNVVTDNSPYNQLRLDKVPSEKNPSAFFRGLSKKVDEAYVPLWSLATDWEDTGTITNYTYDDNSGRLTFDFDITIKKENSSNSSKNNLRILGKFDSGEGKVYKDVVGRKRN